MVFILFQALLELTNCLIIFHFFLFKALSAPSRYFLGSPYFSIRSFAMKCVWKRIRKCKINNVVLFPSLEWYGTKTIRFAIIFNQTFFYLNSNITKSVCTVYCYEHVHLLLCIFIIIKLSVWRLSIYN